MFDTIVAVMPHLKSGRLKALATTGKTRSTLLPDVAAVAETVPGYEASSWGGIVGPAGIPEEVARKINADVVATLRTPEVEERLARLGAYVVANPPAEFAQVIRLEIDKWGSRSHRGSESRMSERSVRIASTVVFSFDHELCGLPSRPSPEGTQPSFAAARANESRP